MSESTGSGMQREAGPGLFLDRTLEIVGSNLRNAEVPDAVRSRILGAVEKALIPVEEPLRKEMDKTAFQIKALRLVTTVVFVVAALVFWRTEQVEDRALSNAYRILVERMALMGKAGSKIQEIMLETIQNWSARVDTDPSSTPEEKQVQRENLAAVAEFVKGKKAMFDDIAAKAEKVKIPDRINAATYLEDPFTGSKLALNSTSGGRLDPNAVAEMMKNEKAFLTVLIMARAGSVKGAKPFAGQDPSQWALTVSKEQLDALGLKPGDAGKAGTETFLPEKSGTSPQR